MSSCILVTSEQRAGRRPSPGDQQLGPARVLWLCSGLRCRESPSCCLSSHTEARCCFCSFCGCVYYEHAGKPSSM